MSDSSGNDYYYLHDHCIEQSEIPPPRDRPAVLVEDNGTVVERYEYETSGRCRITDTSYNSRSTSNCGSARLFTWWRC